MECRHFGRLRLCDGSAWFRDSFFVTVVCLVKDRFDPIRKPFSDIKAGPGVTSLAVTQDKEVIELEVSSAVKGNIKRHVKILHSSLCTLQRLTEELVWSLNPNRCFADMLCVHKDLWCGWR